MTTWYGNSFAGIRNWNTRRASRKALLGLNDRLLRDIGISRSEIGAFVDGLITGR